MRGSILLSAFLVCAVAAQEADQSGVEAENPVQAGMRHMGEKRYDLAYSAFLRAKQQYPDMVEVDFMLGLAANEKGDYSAAIDAFERVMKEKPSDRVKLELARAYLGAGRERHPEARALFNEVLANNPPDAVAMNVRTILARMDQLNQIPSTGALMPGRQPGNTFGGRLNVGFQYDTNPRVSSSNDAISTIIGDMTLDRSFKQKEDFVQTNQLNLYDIYRFCRVPLAWKTDATLYTALHGDQDDLNMLFVQARTGLAYEGERFGSELLGRFNYFEQDYDASMRSWGFEFNNNFKIASNWMVFAGWRHDVKIRHRQTFRNATNDALNFGTMFLLGERHRFSVFGGPEWERANIDEESYNKGWVAVRYDLALPKRFFPYAGYRYSHSSYRAEEWMFGKTRRDDEHEIGVGVKKNWWISEDKKRAFDTDLSYTYYRTYSNIDLYDYKRNVVALNLGFSF